MVPCAQGCQAMSSASQAASHVYCEHISTCLYVWHTACFCTYACMYSVCVVLCVHVDGCSFLPTQHVGRWVTMPECEHTCAEHTCAPPQGLACCFGICAITHLEDTLAQLEDFVRSDVFRKSTSIFSIFKVRRALPKTVSM